MPGYHFRDFINKRTLIIGDVGSGKTTLTACLLIEAVNECPEEGITVIDMAPPIKFYGGRSIGGSLEGMLPEGLQLTYLRSDKIHAPRLEGHNKEEVTNLAEENAKVVSQMLICYAAQPTNVLFINDLSIYLHAGEFSILLDAIRASETFVANAYSGGYINDDHGSGINEAEKWWLNILSAYIDVTINLG